MVSGCISDINNGPSDTANQQRGSRQWANQITCYPVTNPRHLSSSLQVSSSFTDVRHFFHYHIWWPEDRHRVKFKCLEPRYFKVYKLIPTVTVSLDSRLTILPIDWWQLNKYRNSLNQWKNFHHFLKVVKEFVMLKLAIGTPWGYFCPTKKVTVSLNFWSWCWSVEVMV